MSSPTYRVYVSALGNVFMTEIADALTEAIAQCGRDVELFRHGLPTRTPGTVNLVVAPHEYFTLYEGAQRGRTGQGRVGERLRRGGAARARTGSSTGPATPPTGRWPSTSIGVASPS